MTISFHYAAPTTRSAPGTGSRGWPRGPKRLAWSPLRPQGTRGAAPIAADKGSALRELLASRGLRRAVYAGDDTTDLDAFRALASGWEVAVHIAVASAEGPAELVSQADVVLDGPARVLSCSLL